MKKLLILGLIFLAKLPSAYSEEWQIIDHYQVNGGIAKDLTTGLIWMRCSVGQTWNGSSCQGNIAKLSHREAMSIGTNYQYEGLSGWRLPYLSELVSLIYCGNGQKRDKPGINSYGPISVMTLRYCTKGYDSPTIIQDVFPLDSSLFSTLWYWSAQDPHSDSVINHIVEFSDSSEQVADGKDAYAVRLVRSGS